MILFAFNIASAATLAAMAGLAAERMCWRRAVALRHGLLFVCMVVIAAAPLLASLARATGIGIIRNGGPSAQSAAAAALPTATDEPPARVAGPGRVPDMRVMNERSYRIEAARWAAALRRAAELLIAAWAAGTIWQLSRYIRNLTRAGRLSGAAERVGEDVRQFASAAARGVGLRRLPPVAWCALAPTPLVMGLFHPRVLLPRSAAAFSADELEAVLLHELAHIARHDQWSGLLASLLRAVFWWCLPVGMLIRRLGDLREQLCDAQVVGCQGHGLNLAAALVSVCEWSVGRRQADLAPALGAAGSSGRALRDRIQSLVQKDDIPMFHTSLRGRLAVAAAGLFIAGAVTAVNVRVTDAAPKPAAAGVHTPASLVVSAADFWKNAGGAARHDFDQETVEELQKLVDRADKPEYRIRAAKLLCDLAGHSRLDRNLSDAENARVVTAAFEYLEAHLADAEVARYAPQRGFTHMTISETGDQPGIVWVLVETAGSVGSFSGGLNIKVDVKAAKVTDIKQWGPARPAEAAK